MMMNPILGIEPAAGGKAPAAPASVSNKSNNSNEFSDYVTAEEGRGAVPRNAASATGESAASEAEAGDSGRPSKSAGESGNASGEGGTTEETALPEGEAETEADTSALVQLAAEIRDSGDTGSEAEAHVEAGGEARTETRGDGASGRAGQTPDGVDAINDGRSKSSAGAREQERASQAAALPGSEGRTAAQNAALDGGNLAAEGGSSRGSLLSSAPKETLASGAAVGQAAEPAGSNDQHPAGSPARIEEDTVSGKTAATRETADAIRQVADAGGRPRMANAGQAAPGAKDSVSENQSMKSSEAGKAVSGFPNDEAVEQVAARQPEGVARAVAAGAQGTVQALATGLPGSRDSTRNAELSPVSLKISEDAPAEAPAAEKSGSGVFQAGDIRTAAAAKTAQQAAAMFQPLLAGGLTEAAGEAELPFQMFGLSGEAPGLSQLLTEASFGTQTAHRPEMPRLIAAQIAEAFAAKGEQKVEVSLNPQELGHVKMRVVTSETGITMIIQTERPETGDLMRRHINELAEEFRRMGYEDISFEFSGGQTGSGSEDGAEDGSGQVGGMAKSQPGPETAGEQATQNLRLGTAGVDMRV
ncbi:flagellar hook-length control protein FliK [Leisingera sp. JC11]|uniref:flagellar hook-length control protein FliK n=1 Tax=Leisingera sp. JC11 TaxID=3042469 RepID=UPI0034532906